MFDSCFSGSILNLRDRITPKGIVESLRYPVRQFITAGRANEPVPDQSKFKTAFLDLIEGRAVEPYPDGYVTGEELGYYLKHTVPEYSPAQHPQYGKIRDPKLDKGDFLFLVKKREWDDGEVTPHEESPPLPIPEVSKQPVEESHRPERQKPWSITPRVGFSFFTGLAGVEIQYGHVALDVGYIPDDYTTGYAAGLKYYFRPTTHSWFLGFCYAHMGWDGIGDDGREYGVEPVYEDTYYGLAGGYRWQWPQHWSVSLGLGVAAHEYHGVEWGPGGVLQEEDETGTSASPCGEIAVGYRF